MGMYDLGLVGGEVYIDGEFHKANLYSKNGSIVALSKEKLSCEQEIDAERKWILPGFIDPHVHFHLSVGENTSSDDFYTGSVEGAYGGVTTYIDFLDPIKEVSQLEEAFDHRRELARDSVSDYSFHTTIANPKGEMEDILKASIEIGITSVKLFTTYSNTDRRTYDHTIYELLKASKKYHSRIVIHAENDDLIEKNTDILVKNHEKSRPVISETTEIIKLAQMARETKGNLYIVHVSSGSSVKLLEEGFPKELKDRTIILESCPHYFLFNSECYEKEDGYRYTMTPPLRPEKERLLLRNEIEHIMTIGTDHCPFEQQQKKEKYTSKIPMGIGGIRYSFVNMFTEFGADIIDKFTEGPAKAYGLYPRKGNLLPGADADIVLFDPTGETMVNDSESVYHNRCFNGKIEKVFLRGQLMVDKDSFIGGKGIYIRRN